MGSFFDMDDIIGGQDSPGLQGLITQKQFGKTPQLEGGTTGFFGEEGQLRELGGLYADFLLEMMSKPVEETDEFKRGRQVIRDSTDAFGKTQRQRLGDRATTSGFLDSGAVSEGELGIARQEMEAFTKGINELYLGLSAKRGDSVLPFLQSAVQEDLQIDLANLGATMQRESNAMAHKGMISDMSMGPFG